MRPGLTGEICPSRAGTGPRRRDRGGGRYRSIAGLGIARLGGAQCRFDATPIHPLGSSIPAGRTPRQVTGLPRSRDAFRARRECHQPPLAFGRSRPLSGK